MRISGEERSKADDFRSFSSEFVRGETAKLYLKQGQCKNPEKMEEFWAFGGEYLHSGHWFSTQKNVKITKISKITNHCSDE